MESAPLYIGVDVSKATLDICTSDGEAWQTPNDDGAMEELRTRVIALHPTMLRASRRCGAGHRPPPRRDRQPAPGAQLRPFRGATRKDGPH